ncbi:MAG: hypothetical protein JO352_22745 [Chloroflexi bacterium]|nr:hypothetical protein [Chloroflexota bacterium]MBV9602937.1 hypothetical protein [Chloroflexota bacterium]
MQRIGERWEPALSKGPAYRADTRRRRTATRLADTPAAVDLLDHYPRPTVAVLDGRPPC